MRFEGAKSEKFEKWHQNFWKDIGQYAPLSKEEMARIEEFWSELGSAGGEEEAGRLHFFSQYFAAAAERAKEAEKQNTRLCRSLGVCAGGVIALLLI